MGRGEGNQDLLKTTVHSFKRSPILQIMELRLKYPVTCIGQWSPTFLAPGTGFVEDNFSIGRWGRGGWFQMIQAHCIQTHFLL